MGKDLTVGCDYHRADCFVNCGDDLQSLIFGNDEVTWIGDAKCARLVLAESAEPVEIPGGRTDRTLIWQVGGTSVTLEQEGSLVGEVWRHSHCKAKLAVLSFFPLMILAEQGISLADAPGLSFVELPRTLSDLRDTLQNLEKPGEIESHIACRWFSSLDRRWSQLGHDIARELRSGGEVAESLLIELNNLVFQFAPECTDLMNEFRGSIGKDDASSKLGVLQDALLGLTTTVIPPAPSPRPPQGYDSVGVADDDGYDEAAMATLERMGYHLYRPVATDPDIATKLIDRARPTVVLSDVGFPTPIEGLALMTLASERSWVKLVIAVSHGRITPGTLPKGVEDCSGGAEWKDAERIHRIIWRRAIQNGVTRAM